MKKTLKIKIVFTLFTFAFLANGTVTVFAEGLRVNLGAHAEIEARNEHGLPIVHASTSASTTVGQKIKDEKKENRNVRQNVRDQKNASSTENKQRAKLKLRAANLLKNYLNRIGTLERLALRIESRIGKLEVKGISVTESKKLLSDAKAKIASAKTDIASAKNDVDSLLSGAIATDTAGKIQARLSTTENLIKLAHQGIVLTLRSVQAGMAVHATSVASTTPH